MILTLARVGAQFGAGHINNKRAQMNTLWKGNWRVRVRIVSGLVLFIYVLLHFLNIGFGLISLDLAERFQDMREAVHRSFLGSVVLYGAFLLHGGLALWRLARRRTLRMPIWEWVQVALGLTIPFLLITHVVHTRLAHEFFALNDEMSYIVGLIWNTGSGWKQSVLLLITWAHGCMGLHFWMRAQDWWQRSLPAFIAMAVLVPAWALAGFMVQGRVQSAALRDPDVFPALAEYYNWLSAEAFGVLRDWAGAAELVFTAVLILVIAAMTARRLLARRGAVRIKYVSGPEISGQPGMTLLEMSRASGVSHLAMCGGRGRCTTCRVIVEEGAEHLPPPSPQEAASLAAVNAPPNARLACQLRPTERAKVLRVFNSDGGRARAHESLGKERNMAILFLDMRGFTARTTGQLPYDVVFLLNRFFDAIVPSIIGAGGTVDKYLGDGLLAVFEQEDEAASARAAMEAAIGISSALVTFNQALRAEKAAPVAIGMGVHLGTLVIGEIGAAQHAPRTIIGDTVNAASRLEGATKELGVELLVSESALRAVGQDVDRLDLEILELRGVSKPVLALPVQIGSDLRDILAQQAVA
ncbi:adenylate/guanylate cyclase domain-containing protein [Shimia sp. MMG029]|uniref:adenylate/guanylate cyclase domain-containing protein n=1 Tax=Shimia sp. MMG029 TaxID=3021978 RepID=UPI002FDD8AD7